jgi:hypothetical protein
MEQVGPKNITISKRADEICQILKDQGYFATYIDAYKVAVVVALANKIEVDRNIKFEINKWDTAAVFFDREKNLESILLLNGYDKKDLVTEGKFLAEAGLKFLEEKRNSNIDLLPFLIGKQN